MDKALYVLDLLDLHNPIYIFFAIISSHMCLVPQIRMQHSKQLYRMHAMMPRQFVLNTNKFRSGVNTMLLCSASPGALSIVHRFRRWSARRVLSLRSMWRRLTVFCLGLVLGVYDNNLGQALFQHPDQMETLPLELPEPVDLVEVCIHVTRIGFVF